MIVPGSQRESSDIRSLVPCASGEVHAGPQVHTPNGNVSCSKSLVGICRLA